MNVWKKSSLVAVLISMFGVMSILVLNNQTKIQAADEDGSSYVLEKKAETKNQVEFDLKVKDPKKSTITLTLEKSVSSMLHAENILEYLSEEVANELEIVDGDAKNQVMITFKKSLGSYTLPIIFQASEHNKTISDTLKVMKEENVVSKASFDLHYQKEVIETPAITKDEAQVQPRALRSAISVNTWDTFKAALANTAVDVINVEADITRTATNAASAPGTLTRDLTINGNNHKIDFGANNGNLTLGATTTNKLVVNDATITKLGGTAIFDSATAGVWDITFNNVKTPENNAAGVVNATNSTLTLSGENTFYATSNTITILHVFSTNGAKSSVTTNQTSNTLTVWAVGINDGNRGGGTINLDNASLIAHSTGSSSIRLRYGGNKFNVANNSKLTAITDTTSGDAATVRFSTNNPNNEFNISNGSVIDIQHLAGEAPALRLNGDGFITNVSGNSKLNLYNKGSGSASNSSNEALNLPGSNNTFTIMDKDSQVNMIADYGPAVYGNSNTSTINAGPDTEFIARGNTSGAAYGVFNMGANASVLIDNPIYYDFANTRSGGANIFSLSGSGGKFEAKNTDISVWQKGKNVYVDDPLYDWTLIDFTLNGSNLATIASASDPGFKSLFGQPNNYARMSGNNARPIVDGLRTPTNADKSIYGHVSVPEGVEGIRDAWTDEVKVDVTVKNADGSIAYQTLTDDTIGAPGLSLWGEDPKNGMFKIDLPDGTFLKAGQTVEVTGARRFGANSQSGKMHESLPEDIQTTVQTVIDVTPPTQAVVTTDLSNATKQLSGTSDENGAKVFAKVDGEWLKNSNGQLITTTVNAGKWTLDLPKYLAKTATVDVYLKDNTVISPLPAFTLPKTYTQEPDGVFGNISEEVTGYETYSGYHDAVKVGTKDERFGQAKRLIAKDVIPDQSTLVKSVTSSGSNKTAIGDTLTYTLQAENPKAGSAPWKNVELVDVLAAGLEFDPSDNGITINGKSIGEDRTKFSYTEDTRTLKIYVGDLAANTKVTATFNVKIGNDAIVGDDIKNIAQANGDSPQEKPFVQGPINPDSPHELLTINSNEVGLPGGGLEGMLSFVSAPKMIDFGLKESGSYGSFSADNPDYDQSLVVSDSREVLTDWKLSAKVTKVMESTDDKSYKLPEALVYKEGARDNVLKLEEPYDIIKKAKGSQNVSEEEWVKKGNGFKMVLEANQYRKIGEYTATIKFTLSETQ